MPGNDVYQTEKNAELVLAYIHALDKKKTPNKVNLINAAIAFHVFLEKPEDKEVKEKFSGFNSYFRSGALAILHQLVTQNLLINKDAKIIAKNMAQEREFAQQLKDYIIKELIDFPPKKETGFFTSNKQAEAKQRIFMAAAIHKALLQPLYITRKGAMPNETAASQGGVEDLKKEQQNKGSITGELKDIVDKILSDNVDIRHALNMKKPTLRPPTPPL